MRLWRDETAVSETENQRHDLLDEVLHFGAGFKDGEQPWVLEALSALGPHVARWDPDDVDVEISVKDRNLDRVLAEAKRELIRQIEDHKAMREPKHNRQLRKKTTRSAARRTAG